MKTVLLTGGPSWEPLDGMRRLTNASTGRLGAQLAETFAQAGCQVVYFRGEGATAAAPRESPTLRVRSFGTNDDLAAALAEVAQSGTVIDLVLHAAALCDFRVARVRTEGGVEIREAKISTRSGRVTLELEPTTKVLPRLRDWFPRARLVGWKYELNGTRTDALAAAARQLATARTDACVLNGAAWGPGFAFCEPGDRVAECADVGRLSELLLRWTAGPTDR